MASPGTLEISLPDFRGTTRQLVLWNMASFFILLLLMLASGPRFAVVLEYLAFSPQGFLSGHLWQPLTYSLLNLGLLNTFFNLLMLWFLGSLLEDWHGSRWLLQLYTIGVVGAAIVSFTLSLIWHLLGHDTPQFSLIDCSDAIFGLLVAVGVLHGDVEFRLFLLVKIKARYLAIILGLIEVAKAFGAAPMLALATLGAGLFAILFIRAFPRREANFGFAFSERWYGLRNSYYRWKRRRTASKFQVYMKKQGRTVRFDGQGRLLDEDDAKHDDRKRWN